MQINECTHSLEDCVKEYLNAKYDKNICLQNIEKEVSIKNNAESKQHDKYQKNC